MADVYVNALPQITDEPTTTDSLVVVNRNTNEGKIIDYGKLADVILDKLTSKTYSGLNTTSKLLVGAINELDSDVSSLNDSFLSKYCYVPSEFSYSGGDDAAFAQAVYDYAKKDANYISMFSVRRSGSLYLAIVQYAGSSYGTVLMIQYGNLFCWALTAGNWNRYIFTRSSS